MARRLKRFLRARGLDQATVDDVVQETALRALVCEHAFADPAELQRWSIVVARNLATDTLRRAAFTSANEVPDVACSTDVEYIVEQRRRVESLRTAFASLSQRDKQALRTAEAERRRLSAAERNRFSVRLHRARARLMAAIEALGAAVAWLVRRRPVRPRAVVAASLPALALVVGVTLHQLPDLAGQPANGPRPEPSRRTLVTGGQTRISTTATAGHSNRGPAKTPTSIRSVVRVTIPRANGQPDIGAGVRPKQQQDHLACLDTIVVGYHCIDVPAVPPAGRAPS